MSDTEVTVRFLTPDGYSAEMRFSDESAGEAMVRLEKLSTWLHGHGFHSEDLPTRAVGNVTALDGEPRCKECGGPMEHRAGTNQKGKAYSGWFCENDRDHKPIWG